MRIIEGVAWGEGTAIASGWVNSNKYASKEEFVDEMSRLKLVHCRNGKTTELEDSCYAFDSICPKMVNLHEATRETLAVSSLVRDHRFVFLVSGRREFVDRARIDVSTMTRFFVVFDRLGKIVVPGRGCIGACDSR